jgi:hypothetical protein
MTSSDRLGNDFSPDSPGRRENRELESVYQIGFRLSHATEDGDNVRFVTLQC